jgi:hypothetical protein
MKPKPSPKKAHNRHSSAPKRAVKRPKQSKAAPSNWSDLARLLGVTRQALQVHRKRLTQEAPSVGDVDGWTLVLAADDSRTGTAPKKIRESIARARLRLLRTAGDREALKLSKERDEVIEKAVAGPQIARAITAFWNALDRIAEIELPCDLKGCDENQIREKLCAAFHRVKASLRDELEAMAEGGKA